MRGHADAIALAARLPRPGRASPPAPAGQQARAVFDAVEQARVEAIGARRMDGVAENLTAMLDERYHRGKFDEITERADAPLEDAVALMVRERLTGMAPPPAAKQAGRSLAPLIEDRAGRDLDRLDGVIEDQRQFADAVHELLDALEMGEDRSRDSEERRRRRRRGSPQAGPARTATPPMATRCSAEHGGDAGVRRGHADSRAKARRRADRRDGRRHRHGRRRDAGRSRSGRAISVDNQPRGLDYRAFTAEVRRDRRRPRNCASRRSSTGCAPISTSSSPICRARSPGSPTGCSAG